MIVLVIILIMALVAGFLGYRYLKQVRDEIKQREIEEAGWQTDILEIQSELENQESENFGDGGFLTICVDKCGDNFCQTADSVSSDDPNAPCSETAENCPKDCFQE